MLDTYKKSIIIYKTMKIITICSGKGGAGKSTITANLAGMLAQMGKRVLAIDMDIGTKNLDLFLGIKDISGGLYSLEDVIMYGFDKNKKYAVEHNKIKDLWYIPANHYPETSITAEEMSRAVKVLREGFDYILIDAPAGIGERFAYAVLPANAVIVVVNTDIASLRDADSVLFEVEKKYQVPANVVINKYNIPRVANMYTIDEIIKILALDGVLGLIPYDSRIIECENNGDLFVLKYPKSVATHEIRNVAMRMEGKDIPVKDIRKRSIRDLFKQR